ncbi:MAG: phage baseplate assembly protein [Gammaproteobacteria bacterium]
MRDVVTLAVSGGEFAGWTEVEIALGIEQVAGAFDIALSERWPGQAVARPIVEGERCAISIDGEVVITGNVDDVVPSFDAEHDRIQVRGRDATGDLVDCAAIHQGGEWTGATLATIARDLLAPFSIPLTVETDVGGPWTHVFKLQTGETVFEALERAARMRGVLLTSDGRGGLVLTRAGRERIGTALVEGENILGGQGYKSVRERFSEYRVLAQSPGDDGGFGETVAALSAVEKDAGVGRYRPLIIHAEDNADQAALERRARWEKNVRIGRATRPRLTVHGWSHADGVWRPNRLVEVRSPTLKAEGEFLITEVRLRQSNQDGTTAVLTLARPEAFDVEPLAEDAGDSDEGVF